MEALECIFQHYVASFNLTTGRLRGRSWQSGSICYPFDNPNLQKFIAFTFHRTFPMQLSWILASRDPNCVLHERLLWLMTSVKLQAAKGGSDRDEDSWTILIPRGPVMIVVVAGTSIRIWFHTLKWLSWQTQN